MYTRDDEYAKVTLNIILAGQTIPLSIIKISVVFTHR